MYSLFILICRQACFFMPATILRSLRVIFSILCLYSTCRCFCYLLVLILYAVLNSTNNFDYYYSCPFDACFVTPPSGFAFAVAAQLPSNLSWNSISSSFGLLFSQDSLLLKPIILSCLLVN